MPKLISDFVTIATEGPTVDGREITAQQIQEMADNYSVGKYGARIWLEHMRGLFADSAFPALGDVLETKAEKNTDGKLALLARLSPTDQLVSMNKDRQKVYTSIEMDTDFQRSGQAYLVGLAVTDSPASTGTSMLTFSLENKDKAPKEFMEKIEGHEFSVPIDAGKLEFSDEEDKPSLFNRIREMLSQSQKGVAERFDDHAKSITALAESVDKLSAQVADMAATATPPAAPENPEDPVAQLTKQVEDLTKQLNDEPDPKTFKRPEATGGNGQQLADC